MFALEDIIADSFEGHDDEDKASSVVACQKVASLVALCGRIASDPALARQLRRKHARSSNALRTLSSSRFSTIMSVHE